MVNMRMNKKGFLLVLFFVCVVGVFASSVGDYVESEFSGVMNNVSYNSSEEYLQLDFSQTSGSYTSRVLDANSTVRWDNFSFNANSLGELPNNQVPSSFGGVNMSGNVLLLHLNENNGSSVFRDSSGNGNNGSCVSCPNRSFGRFNNGLDFNTQKGYVVVNHSSSLNFSNQITGEAWVKGDTTNNFSIYTNDSRLDSLSESNPQLQVVGDKVYTMFTRSDGSYTQIYLYVNGLDGNNKSMFRVTSDSTSKSSPQFQIINNTIYYNYIVYLGGYVVYLGWSNLTGGNFASQLLVNTTNYTTYNQFQVVLDTNNVQYTYSKRFGSYYRMFTAFSNLTGGNFAETMRSPVANYNRYNPQLQIVGTKVYYTWYGTSATNPTYTQIFTAEALTDGTGYSEARRTNDTLSRSGQQFQIVGTKMYFTYTVSSKFTRASMNLDGTGFTNFTLQLGGMANDGNVQLQVVGDKIYYLATGYTPSFSPGFYTAESGLDLGGFVNRTEAIGGSGPGAGFGVPQFQVVGNKIYYVGYKYIDPPMFFTSKVMFVQKGSNVLEKGNYAFSVINSTLSLVLLEDYRYKGSSASNTSGVVLTSAINSSKWSHVAFTYNKSILGLYLDGILVNSTSYTGEFNLENHALIVGDSTQLNATWDGLFNISMDEVAVYNRTLSASEILERYQRGLMRLNVSVRSCDDLTCTGENFTDVDDSASTSVNVSDNRYFQYFLGFSTENVSFIPKLYNFTLGFVDTYFPQFALSYSPNASAGLDPSRNVTFSPNITDFGADTGMQISSAILEFYNSTDWANYTLTNIGAGVWQTNVTLPSTNDINLTYRIWANDSYGNMNVTGDQTFSSYWDCTFALDPVNFGQVAGFDETARVFNLSINNTGDAPYADGNCSLAFRLNYNLPYGRVYIDDSTFKPSDTYTLNATQSTTVFIDATFLDEVNEETLNITVDDVRGRSSTGDAYSTGLMISSRGGPYLYQEVTSSSSYSLYLKAQNVSLTSRMRNVVANGSDEKSAFNVTYSWELPSYFSILNGSGNQSFENLSDNSFLFNNINLTFNSSNLPYLSPGTYLVIVNSTGVNLTNGSIIHANNQTTLSDTVTITLLCYNQNDGICVASCGYNTDPDCSAPKSGSAGGGGGGGADDSREASAALFELLRGKAQQFVLPISNKLSTAKTDIEISVMGPNAEYIKLLTTKIDRIEANSSKNVTVEITAPAYFSKGEYVLYFDIRGKIDDGKSFYERKKVTLFIVEVSRSSADEYLASSVKMVGEMNRSGMKMDKVSKLINEMNAFYLDYNFEGVQKNSEVLSKIYKAAFDAQSLLEELRAGIRESEKNGVEVIETKKILYVGENAYNRGDYVLAVERLNEAKLSYALETKGEFSIYHTIKNNPVQSVGILVSALIVGLGSTTLIRFRLLKRKLKMLEDEEKLLLELMKVVQREAFEKNSMSMEEYQQAMGQYENKLSQTIEEKITVEAKLLYMFKAKGRKSRYGDERKRLMELIGDLQDRYMNKGTIETRIYGNMLKSYTARLSEIDETLAFLEARKAIKGKGLFSSEVRK